MWERCKRRSRLTEPQAAPAHPCPATPLWTLQVTPVFVVLVTAAKNCCVLGVAPDGGTNAYGGETVTPTGPEAPAMRNRTPRRRARSRHGSSPSASLDSSAGANAGAR